ncbi:VWA domain-containing protein, partial [bacterium]|nr:VWA domain-containing protein [bacterium]
MHFLVPWMLFGALTAGIPVALHLLRKSKPTVLRWAPMEFLRKSMKETSKKVRLRDLLLLLLRMAILILAALALARPSTLSLFGSGPIDAVLLIDNSQSMSTMEGQTSRLDMALTSAKQLIGNLPSGSKARIVSLSDHPVELSYNNANESDALNSALAQIKPSDRSSNFYQGFANAIDLLKNSSFSQRRIFFFSDMQRFGWQGESDSFKTLVQNMPSSISMHMIRHGSDVDSNIQMIDFQPTAGIILANQRQTWGLTVRNRGIKPSAGIKVTLGLGTDFESAESLNIEKLEPGEERQVTLDLLIPEEGQQVVKALAGNDRFNRDNLREKIVLARNKLQVLIVGAKSEIDPNRENSFFLYHAIRSGSSDSSNSGIETKVSSGRNATPDLLDETDIVFMVDPVLTGLDSINDGFLEKLETWVSTGRPLVYFAGGNYAV